MPGLCMNLAATRVRVRVRSPSKQYKKTASFIVQSEERSDEFSFNSYLADPESGNRVMVVVDWSSEAKGALEWALSHTLQSQDKIILLHVAKQDGKGNVEIDEKACNLLRSTKKMCQLKRPEVHVQMVVRQGREKGAIIVEEAKRLKASLLVLGHRKQSFVRRMQMVWTSKKARCRVVDYCIQNAHCMTIAVRRKSKKYGGYSITTKRHKNFWLLA